MDLKKVRAQSGALYGLLLDFDLAVYRESKNENMHLKMYNSRCEEARRFIVVVFNGVP